MQTNSSVVLRTPCREQTCLVIDACQFSPNYDYCFLDALVKQDQKMVFATTEFAHEYIPDVPGVKVFRCFFPLARFVNRLTRFRPLRRLLRAIEYPLDVLILFIYILLKRIKLVHFMWIVWPGFDWRLIKLLRLFGCRVVYTAHNPFPHELKSKHIKKYARIYHTVDHIIGLTNYTREQIVGRFEILPEKVSVIPHGDFDALFSQYGFNKTLAKEVRDKAADRKIIAFLGNIRPYKGLNYFIEALPLIKQRLPESFFLVAGSVLIGDEKNLKGKLAENCKPDEYWADIRFLPVEDLKAYLAVTNVLVQPYVSASQSGNTAMAYAAGIPVISTNVGGLGEMTEDGKTGYVIMPEYPNAIAEAVAKCFTNDNYTKMSRNVRKVVAEQYNWKNIARQTIAAYQRALSSNKPDKKAQFSI
jgi:glycosyltransferase involved in cell wall biosynthesis